MTHAGHVADPGAGAEDRQKKASHYRMLLVMTVVSFLAMYGLMYAMVDSLANVHHNLNQVYMAGLMAAAMILIELVVMRGMYHDRRLNIVIAGAGVLALVAFWLFIRQQTAIGDRQFLNSMIPHHAAAILMCQQASINDEEIKQLCGAIVSSQQAEIEQMKALLNR